MSKLEKVHCDFRGTIVSLESCTVLILSWARTSKNCFMCFEDVIAWNIPLLRALPTLSLGRISTRDFEIWARIVIYVRHKGKRIVEIR